MTLTLDVALWNSQLTVLSSQIVSTCLTQTKPTRFSFSLILNLEQNVARIQNGWSSFILTSWNPDLKKLSTHIYSTPRSQELPCYFFSSRTDLSLQALSLIFIVFNKFPFIPHGASLCLFVAWTQLFLTELAGNVLLSNTKSLRSRPAWPQWTCFSFSHHADREMPINELMKLSNSFRQLLFSLPRTLIRLSYLSSTQATFAVEVRILEGQGENLQVILTWVKVFIVILTDNIVKYSHITKSSKTVLDPKQMFFHFQSNNPPMELLTHISPPC